MSPLTFLDANVPMYAGGGLHRLKEPCLRVLDMAAGSPEPFVTDAEVLQELLHRFRAVQRWVEGRRIFDRFALVMEDRVEPLLAEDVEEAARLIDRYPNHTARDLVHFAVMRRLGCTRIVTADTDFDRFEGITRLDPLEIDSWASTVLADA